MAATSSSLAWRHKWRIIGWGGAAALLTLPAIAMQFTREVNWKGSDFAVMGAMMLLAGLALEGLVRTSPSWPFRIGAAVAVLAGFLMIWVNLAVGVFGDEDNLANLMFLAVIAVAIIGSLLARGRAAAMATAMGSAAASVVAVSAIAWFGEMTPPGARGVYEVVVSTALFGGLWLISAALFHLAASSAVRIS